jgi:monoamine oxidase
MVYDSIVVGAGAAGLACTEKLSNHGARVLLLEGRSRLGGRVFSAPLQGWGSPVELGAEFIHGNPNELMSAVEETSTPIIDVCDMHLFRKGRRLVDVDFWRRIEAIASKLEKLKKDESAETWIAKAGLGAENESLIRDYVEGFLAADPRLIGVKEIAGAQDGEKSLNGSALFRFSEGFSRFLTARYYSKPEFMKCVRFKTILKNISIKKNIINLECNSIVSESLKFQTKTLVLAVPLSVLKAPPETPAGITWSPPFPALESLLSKIHMGHVQRIVFHFRSRFWEKLSSEKPVSFLHIGPEFYFPTWWSLMPLRAPILVAWQGGPKALGLAVKSLEQRVAIAMQTLSDLTGISKSFIASELIGYYSHDWSNDPFTLGAYSYIGVNGSPSAKRLEKPFFDRIFFCGEGTISGAARGTVHGALRSGLRAADQVQDFL